MVSPQKISTYLRKPQELDAAAEQDLREVVKKYPYFNNAWLLLARALHNQNSPLFDESLKQAAMYAGDRALLYKLVNVDDADAVETTTAPKAPPAAPLAAAVEATPATIAEEPIPAAEEESYIADTFEDTLVVEDTPAPIVEETTAPVVEEPGATTDEETGVRTGNTEEDMVVSAYREIFGTDEEKTVDANIASEFETFEVTDEYTKEQSTVTSSDEPAEEEDEEEFILEMEDFSATTDEKIVADMTLESVNTETADITEVDNIEEEFELSLADHLDPDADGIATPPPVEEKSEEEFELQTADHIAEEHSIDTEEPVAEEEPAAIAEHTATTEEPVELATPIDFKLNKTPETTPAPEVTETEETHLVEPGTFYEWLAKLKDLQGATEKKNDPVKAEETSTKAETTATPGSTTTPAKKSSVDDIIDRFITIQPTISRPKAEFYNPTVKAKESDSLNDDLATETLGRIYRTQKLYDRALEVYSKLVHKYPQKAGEYKAIISEINTEKGN